MIDLLYVLLESLQSRSTHIYVYTLDTWRKRGLCYAGADFRIRRPEPNFRIRIGYIFIESALAALTGVFRRYKYLWNPLIFASFPTINNTSLNFTTNSKIIFIANPQPFKPQPAPNNNNNNNNNIIPSSSCVSSSSAAADRLVLSSSAKHYSAATPSQP